jgi:hypothetical protein
LCVWTECVILLADQIDQLSYEMCRSSYTYGRRGKCMLISVQKVLGKGSGIVRCWIGNIKIDLTGREI